MQRAGEAGRQHLHAADAGHHLDREVDLASLAHLVEDPQGAVVESGVAPHEERPDLAVAELVADEPLVDGQPLLVPGGDVVAVGRPPEVPGRVGGHHLASRTLGVAGQDLLAHRGQVGAVVTLVEHEHDIGPVQGTGGLDREVVGVAGPDSDDEHGAHRASLAHAAAGPPRRISVGDVEMPPRAPTTTRAAPPGHRRHEVTTP